MSDTNTVGNLTKMGRPWKTVKERDVAGVEKEVKMVCCARCSGWTPMDDTKCIKCNGDLSVSR